MKKGIIYRVSPFNNESNVSDMEYIIKKLLAFILIYGISAVLGEAVVIGILYGLGYDPLQGIMPQGPIGELLLYYGLIVFILVTLLYCRIVEKKTIKSIVGSWNPFEYLLGALLAIILLALIIFLGCIFDAMTFHGVNTNIDICDLLLWLAAFVIQGAEEEVMCRGFLLQTLKKRISVPISIVISSCVFIIPHLSGLCEADTIYVMIGIINIFLVSVVFSILVLRRLNLWMACGLHSIWNFAICNIMGLTLSGNNSASNGILLFSMKNTGVLNGGEYGIEASIITTVIHLVLLIVLVKKGKAGQ